MVRWVNWALAPDAREGPVLGDPPGKRAAAILAPFAKNVPRPNNILRYPARGDDPLAQCP